MKKGIHIVLIMVYAGLSALNYAIFVFPNSFAPAGIDGICTIIQDMANINIGYLSLCVNIPLLLLSFIFLNRDFSVKSTVYILSFAAASILLGRIDMASFCYFTETGTSIILAPVVAGTIRGLLYYFTLKINGSSGGVDLISALIKQKKPYLDLMRTIFFFNMLVALCSYFVYDFQPEPVICSVLYSFITTSVTNCMQGKRNKNVKYEIITPNVEKFYAEFADKFHQSATVLDAHGAYSGADTKMVVCVVNQKNAPYIEEILLRHPECVVFKSTVGSTLSGVTYK